MNPLPSVLRSVQSWGLGGASRDVDLTGKVAAIDRVMGVIEFSLDGRVLTANDNFLQVLGYSLDEVKDQHHSLFVDPIYRDSDEYRRFWEKLGRGEFDAFQYRRIGKNGHEVWIQASYIPTFDASGKPLQGGQVRHRHHRAETSCCQLRGPDVGHRSCHGRDRTQSRWPRADRRNIMVNGAYAKSSISGAYETFDGYNTSYPLKVYLANSSLDATKQSGDDYAQVGLYNGNISPSGTGVSTSSWSTGGSVPKCSF